MPIKDQQIRREYFKEYMAKRRKGLTVKPSEAVKPEPVLLSLDLTVKPLVSVKPENVKSSPVVKPTENVKPQLWANYYSVKKPYCYSCQQKGISETDYAFCSREKIKDVLSIRLPNRYYCNVYHWTLYQGQGKIKGRKV